MVRYIIYTLLSVLSINICYGQADVHFSQFYETSIIRNPALTGVFADDYKVSCFYRSQWASVSMPYNTMLFSGETKVPIGAYSDDFISFGLLAYRDKAGIAGQQITNVYPAFNFNKSLDPNYNSYISFGVAGAYSQYSFDPGQITFNNQYQNGVINTALPSLENIANSKMSFWNLAAGLNFNASSNQDNKVVYCFGVAGYNLTEKPFSYFKQSIAKINLRGSVNAAMAIELREDIKIQFQANYAQQGKFNEIMGAFLWAWSPVDRYNHSAFGLTLGAIYRYNDAVAPVVKMRVGKATVSASYDVNISTFQPATQSRGGFEVSLSVSGDYNQKNAREKTTICPRF